MTWRTSRREDKQLALLWGAVVAASLSLVPLWRVLAPLLPGCPMRIVTGIPCPTCGATRAALALFRGDVTRALALNPLVSIAGIAFVAGGFLAPIWSLSRGPVPVLPRPLPMSWRLAAAAALIANWAYIAIRRI